MTLGIFGSSAVALPDGLTPDRWVAEVKALQGAGFESRCSEAVAHYLRTSDSYVRQSLAGKFPGSYRHMIEVSLGLLRAIIDHKARVFTGAEHGEKFTLDTDNEEQQERFSAALDAAALPLALRRADRRAELLRRSYLRFAWDPHLRRVRVAVLGPHQVFPRFALDSWSLDAARGVLVKLAPAVIDGRTVQRFEFWSADPENPRNMIVDESGRRLDKTEGVNPYRNAAGLPIVPLVSFATEAENDGYWLGPSMDLLRAQRAIDTDISALMHLAATCGFGILAFEQTGGGGTGVPVKPPGTPDPKGDGRVLEYGPDVPIIVPEGYTAKSIIHQADFAGIFGALDSTLRRILALERIPASALLLEQSQQSGYAVRLQNAPLEEARAERIEMHRATVQDALERFAAVHNWHADEPERFTGTPSWQPGRFDLPQDPAEEARSDAQRVALGTLSAVEIIMRERDIERPEAEEIAAQLARDNAAHAQAVGQGLGRLAGFGTGAGTEEEESEMPAEMPPAMRERAREEPTP